MWKNGGMNERASLAQVKECHLILSTIEGSIILSGPKNAMFMAKLAL